MLHAYLVRYRISDFLNYWRTLSTYLWNITTTAITTTIIMMMITTTTNKQRWQQQQLRRVRLSACSLTLKVKLILPTFSWASYVFPPFRLIPFVTILCKCCSHSCWYCCISRSTLVIPNTCHKNFICDASSLCFSFLQHPGFTTKFHSRPFWL